MSAPRFEHHREPLGIGESRPAAVVDRRRRPAGGGSRAYRIEVRRREVGDPRPVRGASAEQVLVAWPGASLASRERADVRVSVRGDDGDVERSGPVGRVETGLLEPADWIARPVGAIWKENPASDRRRPSLVRREFRVRPGLVRARLYATAHGLYQAEINGTRVGDDVLSPAGPSTASACATHLRRDRPARRRGRTPSARGSATAGTAGGSAGAAGSATSSATTSPSSGSSS